MENRYKFISEGKQHLHTLDNKPLIGTSTVLGVVSKPLTFWAAELAAVECLEKGAHIPTIREEYLACVASGDKKKAIDELSKKYPIFKKARFAHFEAKNEAADKGTDLHAILEKIAKHESLTEEELKHKATQIFKDWANENIKRVISSEGHCYSEKYWIGGITDLVFEDKKGRTAIMDFKSSKEAYMPQFWQCLGYAIQIEENGIFDSEGNLQTKVEKIDYCAVFPFGAENPEPQFFYDVEGGKEAFLAALTIHKKLN